MMNLLAINGSPSMEKGQTMRILTPFLERAKEAGASIEILHASRIKPEDCIGHMSCWYSKPGKCHIKDTMQEIYPKLREADILVLATPVYIPLPGYMQNFINRLCPLMEPRLEFNEGRTRARLRDDVRIKKLVLVSTGAWWEIQNFDPLVRIAEELAIDTGLKFSGALLRPHAQVMGRIPEKQNEIFQASFRAGTELVREGAISGDTLAIISQPLVPEEVLRGMLNDHWEKTRGKEKK